MTWRGGRRSAHRRAARALAAAAAWALAALVAGEAGADDCAPWPGEPEPLPTPADASPIRARWAELRVEELAAHARRLEQAAPLEARRLWRHVLCIDGQSGPARAGLERTRPVRVHRLALAAGDGPPSPPPADAWTGLAAPISLARAARPAPRDAATGSPDPPRAAGAAPEREAERARILAGIDGLLDDAEGKLRAARFVEASEGAAEARARIDRMRRGPELARRAVRLEVLDATARLALGQDEAARASLRRALRSDPGLALDPATTSPKVLRALEAARRESDPAP